MVTQETKIFGGFNWSVTPQSSLLLTDPKPRASPGSAREKSRPWASRVLVRFDLPMIELWKYQRVAIMKVSTPQVLKQIENGFGNKCSLWLTLTFKSLKNAVCYLVGDRVKNDLVYFPLTLLSLESPQCDALNRPTPVHIGLTQVSPASGTGIPWSVPWQIPPKLRISSWIWRTTEVCCKETMRLGILTYSYRNWHLMQ